MSLVANEEFQHILRVLNTNVDGKQKIMFALTSIKGIGRRLANIVCKKADVDMNKRAGELSAAEIDNLMTIVANPRQFKIPDWFLNRQKDYKDGKYSQVVSNALDMKLRDDLERLKKIRNHRGLRHYWGLRVRGQHTKTTGRRGKTVELLSLGRAREPSYITPKFRDEGSKLLLALPVRDTPLLSVQVELSVIPPVLYLLFPSLNSRDLSPGRLIENEPMDQVTKISIPLWQGSVL
ncbi:unnamed protein product [Arabidopsis arenosa]|uniref:40S ribosomal protein S18 n=1 Tax=Arabidopsis arenosa TaxID=38785 RepID=A0A8S1ZGZ6_ARAAE|nr:unnamed protein product [Arabidopsis arenosa]